MPGFHITGAHRQVTTQTEMRLVSVPDELAVTATLQYTSRDPYALSVVFATEGCAPVVWVFARDLLLAGVTQAVGDGDVRIFPAGDSVVLDLASPDGTARLVAKACDIAAFVGDMLAAVPLAQESAFIDMDAELSLLRREAFAEWGDV